MGSLSSPLLVLVFVVGAVAIWIAGTVLSKTTDVLDRHFGFGEALGGVLVIFVVSGVLMGSLLPASVKIGPVSPASLGIAIAWMAGIYAINQARKAPRWKVEMPGSSPGRPHRRIPHPKEKLLPA